MVMKRGSDMDSPRRNKRTRGGLDVLHTVNIGRFSSESDRRARGLPLDTRTFNPKSERSSHVHILKSEFGTDSFKGKRTERDEEASIRVTNFTRGAEDHVLRDKLNYEFKKFGEITVRIMRHGEERYAVVYFRNSDDAVEAKRSIENRGRAIFLQDRALNLQFSIPSNRSARRFTPDVVEQESRFNSRGSSPRNKLQNDVLDIANVERNFERRNRKGERFYSGQATASSTFSSEEEDDPKATRTLFVGNLESSISRQDVRREFEQFGVVEDVDIKRPIRGQGSTYAFVKFIDLDVASKAKVAMQGSFFGRNRVKIGYGKSMPTTRLWIGGLGSWTSIVELEREFDRFGAIRRIDYNKGHDHAFILYDSLDAASVASREMRGFKLNGRRIKIDFADLTQGLEEYPDTLAHLTEDVENQFTSPRIQDDLAMIKSFNKSPEKKSFVRERNNSEGSGKWSDSMDKDLKKSSGKPDGWMWLDEKEDKQKSEERPKLHGLHTPSPASENQNLSARNHRSKDRTKSREKFKSGNGVSRSRSPPAKRPRKTSGPAPALSPQRFGSISPKRKSCSTSPVTDCNHKSDKDRKEKDHEKDKNMENQKTEENKDDECEKYEPKEIVPTEELISSGSESLQDIAKRFAVAWRGSLILKNSSFPVRLHLIGGNPEVVEVLLRSVPGNTAPNTVLRISQRLRLDQPKLEEVSKRMNTAGASGYCMLLALPGVQGGEPPLDTDTNTPTQQRPLRNLVTYLKQKQAAGVVNLINTSNLSPSSIKDEGGVLHAFPPCQYSHDQLLKIAPHLGQEAFKEDHLVVVVIRGPA